MGRACLRQIIDQGEFELVGVYVIDQKKVGLDAGVINETPRCKQRGIYFASKIYSMASHGEFNPRTRLNVQILA